MLNARLAHHLLNLFALVSVTVPVQDSHAQSTVTPVQVTFRNSQGLSLLAHRFDPSAGSAPRPAIVVMHGCSGLYSNSAPNTTKTNLQNNFREWGSTWANMGYVVLMVDGYSTRTDPATGAPVPQNQCGNGSAGVSEVTERPLDALAGYAYLAGTPELQINANRVMLHGFSNGGSAVMAVLSDTSAIQPFRAGVAYYPGCGLFNAFGGLSKSTYKAYAPLKIFHGTLDPLYTAGACQKRIDRAWQAGVQTMTMEPQEAAKHSFDGCYALGGSAACTEADLRAKSNSAAGAKNFLQSYLQ